MAQLVENLVATPSIKQVSASFNRQEAFTELPLLERDKELSKLLQHAARSESFLVCGVAGSGKTRLLFEAEEKLTNAGKNVLYIPFVQPLHAFLASLAARLGFRSTAQSSVVLRGLLWKKLETEPRIILIDDISEASTSFYRFFERLLYHPSFTLIGSAPNPYVLGSFHRVLWNQQAIASLRLLSKAAASSLADAAIRLFVPDLPDATTFRDQVLQAARGNWPHRRNVHACGRPHLPERRSRALCRLKYRLVYAVALMRDSSEILTERFNEPQQRRLLASASYIDKLLLDIDQIISPSSSGGFPKYRNPLVPVQVRVVRDYIKRLRKQIVCVLADLDIALPEPRFDSAFSIKVTLQFIEVALEEIAPRRLTGYGVVPESLVSPLAGGIQEMKGIVRQINSYLNQRVESDLSNRLLQISDAGEDGRLLRSLGDILDRYSFVEFRAPLAQLVDKIQSPSYDIAFFGRVSTGKSSLLNAIIGGSLLPVGVTPITAVPTRIKNGPASKLFVWKAEGGLATYPVDQLAEFVTETRNPGNEKRVTRLIVEVPLPSLPQEVTLVDTPGLGSLALEGGAETLAYLPRCDLGVVLVDATSNLQADDVGTIDALRAASIPALVVLSKVDLVPANDRHQLLYYTRIQLARQIGLELDVAPLSSRPEFSSLLEEWIASQLKPRMADAQQLARESNHRKIRFLGKRILYALEMSMKTAGIPSTESLQQIRKAETDLRQVASLIERTREKCFELTDGLRDLGEQALDWLAAEAMEFWRQATAAEPLDQLWLNGKVIQLAQTEAESIASLLQETAQRLTAALNLAAAVLTMGGREDRFSREDLVKEMPPAEFISTPAHYERPRLFSLSSGLAQRSVRHEIESRVGLSIREFFTSYGRMLEVWVRGTLDGLVHEFEAHADVFRAHIQRVTADAAAPAVSQARVHDDLAFLRDQLGYEEELDLVQAGTAIR